MQNQESRRVAQKVKKIEETTNCWQRCAWKGSKKKKKNWKHKRVFKLYEKKKKKCLVKSAS